jgi:hypothetical protein
MQPQLNTWQDLAIQAANPQNQTPEPQREPQPTQNSNILFLSKEE